MLEPVGPIENRYQRSFGAPQLAEAVLDEEPGSEVESTQPVLYSVPSLSAAVEVAVPEEEPELTALEPEPGNELEPSQPEASETELSPAAIANRALWLSKIYAPEVAQRLAAEPSEFQDWLNKVLASYVGPTNISPEKLALRQNRIDLLREFINGRTQEEIGEANGYTRQNVGQILKRLAQHIGELPDIERLTLEGRVAEKQAADKRLEKGKRSLSKLISTKSTGNRTPRTAVRGNIKSQRELEDLQLVLKARDGSDVAMDQVIRRYTSFVRLKASSYFLAGGGSDDLMQEGLVGLYKAVRDFDPAKEVSFRSFAELCITRQIITAVKTATRFKHSPLNSYVSFSHTPSNQEAEDCTLGEVLPGPAVNDPSVRVIATEELGALVDCLTTVLSPLESDALRLYLEGSSYEQMSDELGCDTKTIDNALQRVKRKILTHQAARMVMQ